MKKNRAPAGGRLLPVGVQALLVSRRLQGDSQSRDENRAPASAGQTIRGFAGSRIFVMLTKSNSARGKSTRKQIIRF